MRRKGGNRAPRGEKRWCEGTEASPHAAAATPVSLRPSRNVPAADFIIATLRHDLVHVQVESDRSLLYKEQRSRPSRGFRPIPRAQVQGHHSCERLWA